MASSCHAHFADVTPPHVYYENKLLPRVKTGTKKSNDGTGLQLRDIWDGCSAVRGP